MAVMVILSMLVVLGLCALSETMSIARNVERSNTLRAELDLGDGALDYAFGYWRQICRMKTNVSRPGNDFANLPVPTASMFSGVTNFTAQKSPNADPNHPSVVLANFQIQATDPEGNIIDQSATPPSGVGMSVGTQSVYYVASADVTLPTQGKPLTTKLRRVFQKQIISPWNYAIFYVDDLEIAPSPPMTITGWVQSNSSVYTPHNTLTFASKMNYANDWYIGFKPGDSTHPETPTTPSWPSNLPPTREQAAQPYGLDSSQIFSTTDTNPNNDSYREIVQQQVAGFTDPFTNLTDPLNPMKARYYDQADIKIIVGAAGVYTILDNNNNVIGQPPLIGPNLNPNPNATAIYNTYSSAITTNQTIQDNREAAKVTLTTLDISKIYAAYKTGGVLANTGFQGIIYMTDTTAAAAPSNQRRAMRLKNGQFIPPGGLTIASDDGIYVQGDFNTGASGTTLPPSDASGSSNDPTKPVVSGYTKQSCAIVGDAVMILSNNWKDTNSTLAVASRAATNTTVNSAIISGIVPTGTAGGNYSGGAENFPRFLEDWSSSIFTYYGSMVELYTSSYFTGVWGTTNVYNPPTRKWYFDTMFYKTPPPGTLTLVLYNKGRWFRQ